MARFDIVTKGEMMKGNYRLIFYLGHGLYQCFPSWKDFIYRDMKVDSTIDTVFEQSVRQKQCFG